MKGKIFSVFIAIMIILLLVIYWFIPYNTIQFEKSSNSNFNANVEYNSTLQFYPNMRFPNPNISYKIEDCPLKRQNDMVEAFRIVEEETILNFYPSEYSPEITVTCQDSNKEEGNLFIAGEGGPTDITIAGDFNIIKKGKILLIKDSKCERPNVAIHELLHVLGFDHSENPNNIMYEISRCDQEIGTDMINFLNEIYSIPSQPDLQFKNASVLMHGKYLDVNFSLINNGIKKSGESIVKIIVDDKEVEEVQIPEIEIGYGRKIFLSNIWVKQISVQEVECIIENNFTEIDKSNNRVVFKIKK